MDNENNDYEGIVLSENAEKAELVENVEIPENTLKSGSIENAEKTKKKKKKFGKFLVFLIVLIAIIAGGGYYYLHYMCTPEKFIDYSVKNMNSTVNNVFNNTVDFNALKDDYMGSGTLEINSNEEMYKSLDGLKLDYSVGLSLNSDYVSLDGKFTQGSSANLSVAAYVDKENIYVDLKDIYNVLLNYNIGENYFEKVKEELKKTNDITVDDFHTVANKAIMYLGEALKEIDSESSVNGLNIEYVFNVNKDNYNKFSKKYKELLLNDEQFKELNEKFNIIDNEDTEDEYLSFEDTIVNIKVNPITREIASFKITSGDESIIGQRTDKNTYRITSDKTVINAEVSNAKLVLDISEDGENIAKFSGVINNNKMSYNLKSYDNNMEIDIEVTKLNKKEMKVDTKASYEGINIKNSITSKFGNSIVKKEKIGNYRRIDDLTENEMNYIQTKLMEKLGKFKAYEEFSTPSYSSGYYY